MIVKLSKTLNDVIRFWALIWRPTFSRVGAEWQHERNTFVFQCVGLTMDVHGSDVVCQFIGLYTWWAIFFVRHSRKPKIVWWNYRPAQLWHWRSRPCCCQCRNWQRKERWGLLPAPRHFSGRADRRPTRSLPCRQATAGAAWRWFVCRAHRARKQWNVCAHRSVCLPRATRCWSDCLTPSAGKWSTRGLCCGSQVWRHTYIHHPPRPLLSLPLTPLPPPQMLTSQQPYELTKQPLRLLESRAGLARNIMHVINGKRDPNTPCTFLFQIIFLVRDLKYAILTSLSVHKCTDVRKKRLYLWWSSCTLYLHACQVRVTTGDSGL